MHAMGTQIGLIGDGPSEVYMQVILLLLSFSALYSER